METDTGRDIGSKSGLKMRRGDPVILYWHARVLDVGLVDLNSRVLMLRFV